MDYIIVIHTCDVNLNRQPSIYNFVQGEFKDYPPPSAPPPPSPNIFPSLYLQADIAYNGNYSKVSISQWEDCIHIDIDCALVSRRNEKDLTYGKSKLNFVEHALENIPPVILIQKWGV